MQLFNPSQEKLSNPFVHRSEKKINTVNEKVQSIIIIFHIQLLLCFHLGHKF